MSGEAERALLDIETRRAIAEWRDDQIIAARLRLVRAVLDLKAEAAEKLNRLKGREAVLAEATFYRREFGRPVEERIAREVQEISDRAQASLAAIAAHRLAAEASLATDETRGPSAPLKVLEIGASAAPLAAVLALAALPALAIKSVAILGVIIGTTVSVPVTLGIAAVVATGIATGVIATSKVPERARNRIARRLDRALAERVLGTAEEGKAPSVLAQIEAAVDAAARDALRGLADGR